MTLASTGVAAPTLIIMSEVPSSAKLKTPPTGVSSLSSSRLTVLPRVQNLSAALTKGSSIWHPAVSAEYYIHSIPLKKHKLEQLETLCKRINYGELKLAAIRDIYFHVKNSLQALQLLRYLLFFPEPYDGKSVNFQKSIETFVERYKKYILSKGVVDDLTHTAMVPPILWNSKIL